MAKRNTNSMKHGTIEMVLLMVLSKESKYGYQIIQEISESQYSLKEATMYPTLYRLEENGYLKCETVPAGIRRTRVYYSITESGKAYLDHLLQDYDQICKAIKNIRKRTMQD